MFERASLRQLLALFGTAVLALAVSCAYVSGESSPPPAKVPAQVAHTAIPTTDPFVGRKSPTRIGESAAASSPKAGTNADDLSVSRRFEDPAALQQLVQFALLGDNKGMASRAAIAIGRCLNLEAGAEELRTFVSGNRDKLEDRARARFSLWIEREIRKCQALDAYSRTQWLPLLRRGLEEGKVGDADEILSAFRGGPYEQQVKAEVLKSLRADAFACHEDSLVTLYYWSRERGDVLTHAEAAAFWQVRRSLTAAKPAELSQMLPPDPSKPDLEGDPEEVRLIVEAIRSRC